MVKIGLQISAQFENIEELKTCHPNYPFFVKIRCNNCGEQDEKWHDITESERVAEDSRNPKGFHFYMKCKLCNRENSIDIIEGSNGECNWSESYLPFVQDDSSKNVLAIYTEADVGKLKTIVTFDCRGIEPVEFSPRSGWIAIATNNGPTFEDIDLSDDDWADYDEKNNQSVGITEFKSQFIKLKK